MLEEAFTFQSGQNRLVGIHHNRKARNDIGVLIIVGGRQYRVGAHRQFVSIARLLSNRGHTVLRFDVQGMGDSEGKQTHFLALHEDISNAVNVLLERSPQLKGIMLWGLCDGASAAIVSASKLPKITGVMMLNPWISTEESAARTHVKHYYRGRLTSRIFWSKLFSGKINWIYAFTYFVKSIKKIIGGPKERSMSLPDIVVGAVMRFDGPMAIVLSSNDLTAREFKEEFEVRMNKSSLIRKNVDIQTITADHTFSSLESYKQLCSITCKFIEKLN